MIHCTSCGAEAEDNAKFCPRCGCGMEQADSRAKPAGAATDASGNGSSSSGSSASATTGTGSASPQASPEKYTVWSILVLLFCCTIGGIIALVYGSKVDSLMLQGRPDEARKASETAKTWLVVSAIVGGGIQVLGIVVMIIAAAAGALD